MSATWKCSKCGVKCISKNPAIRSVFIEQDTVEKMLAVSFFNHTTAKLVPYTEGSTHECLQIETGCYKPGADIVVKIRQFCNSLQQITDEQWKQHFCDHSWEHVEGPILED